MNKIFGILLFLGIGTAVSVIIYTTDKEETATPVAAPVMPAPMGFGAPQYVKAGFIAIGFGMGGNSKIRRNRDSAAKLAVQLRKAIKAGEISFEEAARKLSDAPSKKNGGVLGFVRIEEVVNLQGSLALFQMKPGEVSRVVDAKTAFFIFSSLAFERKHYKGIYLKYSVDEGKSRTKKETHALISSIYNDITSGVISFEDAAKTYNDILAGPGGYLGEILPGRKGKWFDQAADKLKIGEISTGFDDGISVALIKRCEPIFYTYSYAVFTGDTKDEKIKAELLKRALKMKADSETPEQFYKNVLNHHAAISWDDPWYRVSRYVYSEKVKLHQNVVGFLEKSRTGVLSEPMIFSAGVFLFMKEDSIGMD